MKKKNLDEDENDCSALLVFILHFENVLGVWTHEPTCLLLLDCSVLWILQWQTCFRIPMKENSRHSHFSEIGFVKEEGRGVLPLTWWFSTNNRQNSFPTQHQPKQHDIFSKHKIFYSLINKIILLSFLIKYIHFYS